MNDNANNTSNKEIGAHLLRVAPGGGGIAAEQARYGARTWHLFQIAKIGKQNIASVYTASVSLFSNKPSWTEKFWANLNLQYLISLCLHYSLSS